MTDTDIIELARFQSAPEGSAFIAIHQINSDVEKLERIAMTRAGAQVLRTKSDELASLALKLQLVLRQVRPELRGVA